MGVFASGSKTVVEVALLRARPVVQIRVFALACAGCFHVHVNVAIDLLVLKAGMAWTDGTCVG